MALIGKRRANARRFLWVQSLLTKCPARSHSVLFGENKFSATSATAERFSTTIGRLGHSMPLHPQLLLARGTAIETFFMRQRELNFGAAVGGLLENPPPQRRQLPQWRGSQSERTSGDVIDRFGAHAAWSPTAAPLGRKTPIATLVSRVPHLATCVLLRAIQTRARTSLFR